MGNNIFTKSPIGLTRQPFCDIWDKYYRKKFMKNVEGISNLPQLTPTQPHCPLYRVRLFFNTNSFAISHFIKFIILGRI